MQVNEAPWLAIYHFISLTTLAAFGLAIFQLRECRERMVAISAEIERRLVEPPVPGPYAMSSAPSIASERYFLCAYVG